MNHALKRHGKIALSCLLTCLLLFACTQKNHSVDMLNQAYDLVETNPSETLHLLDSIENPKGLEEYDYMRYLTIYSYANVKLETINKNDTLIYFRTRVF